MQWRPLFTLQIAADKFPFILFYKKYFKIIGRKILFWRWNKHKNTECNTKVVVSLSLEAIKNIDKAKDYNLHFKHFKLTFVSSRQRLWIVDSKHGFNCPMQEADLFTFGSLNIVLFFSNSCLKATYFHSEVMIQFWSTSRPRARRSVTLNPFALLYFAPFLCNISTLISVTYIQKWQGNIKKGRKSLLYKNLNSFFMPFRCSFTMRNIWLLLLMTSMFLFEVIANSKPSRRQLSFFIGLFHPREMAAQVSMSRTYTWSRGQ